MRGETVRRITHVLGNYRVTTPAIDLYRSYFSGWHLIITNSRTDHYQLQILIYPPTPIPGLYPIEARQSQKVLDDLFNLCRSEPGQWRRGGGPSYRGRFPSYTSHGHSSRSSLQTPFCRCSSSSQSKLHACHRCESKHCALDGHYPPDI